MSGHGLDEYKGYADHHAYVAADFRNRFSSSQVQAGLDEFFAQVLRQDRAAKVKEVQARCQLVAMTGDGVSDAPALAQADFGIAIGAGSDVAGETAAVILFRGNPAGVVAILKVCRATDRKMMRNRVPATGFNVVAIPLVSGGVDAWGVLLTPVGDQPEGKSGCCCG